MFSSGYDPLEWETSGVNELVSILQMDGSIMQF